MFIDQCLPPKPQFSVDQLPYLSGQVMIVTGANTGIGKVTAKALLAHNAKVYFACRNELFLQVDFADLNSIKCAAEEFTSRETELHVLFNNSGVFSPPLALIEQGYDLQFGVNMLGVFYFTKLLIPTLMPTSTSNPEFKPRIINTASLNHIFVNGLKFDTFKDGPKRRKMNKMALYSQSKFAMVTWTTELARRYADQGIIAISVNPGNLRSEMQRHISPFERTIMACNKTILYPVDMGGLTQLYAATMSDSEMYMKPWARVGAPFSATKNEALGRQLWEYLEDVLRKSQRLV
ncbi:NAD(P)-binding protein [Desarmillaria tabescens]|uniref:NAD(P)-binding protein n=1 Tax=Armillaria tabescens TaxID=1929756 RepID=A0AA39J9Z6_ARMTA|nr:NAD(P)-binding protein [Desarmillaria tabescens]KAK0437951.1 NAD(P)-binding protein [Desarmillaria tabescens]